MQRERTMAEPNKATRENLSPQPVLDQLLPLRSCLRFFRQRVLGESAWLNGILIDASHELLLLQMVSNDIYLNGYQIIRRRDISHIEFPIPHEAFILKALALRDQRPSHPGHINLTTMESALKSIARLSDLVIIHQEITDPDMCWVGHIKKLDNELLQLRTITPDAVLVNHCDDYDTECITRVEFDSAYTQALWQVCTSNA